MADGAGVFQQQNTDRSKSVSRTTSETLRLNEQTAVNANSLATSVPRKKTSFQITSVIVGSRASNDGGEDSADDLDESHTEDIDNSRENETPSYSEDTFSKDDVFFNASSSLVPAPVIPTSSQYGLALVPNSEAGERSLGGSAIDSSEHLENAGEHLRVEVSESVINLGVVSTKHDSDMRDPHPPAPRTERFKVVKIESTEPFKRGRWVCMDYLDHNIQNPSPNKTEPEVNHQSDTGYNNSHEESTVVEIGMQNEGVPHGYTVSVSPGQSLQNNIQMPPSGMVNSNSVAPQQPQQPPPPQQQQQQAPPQPQQTQQQQQQQQQSQSLSQVHMQQILSNANQQHQSLQPQQIQQVMANANVQQQQQPAPPPQQAPQAMQTQPMPQQQQQQQQPPQQQQQPQMMAQQQMPPQMQYQPQQPTQQQQQQQFQQMMQQQMPPQMQQVHMQPQMMPQQMQQMPQQPHQVSYSQPMQQNQPPVVTQTSSQGMMQNMHPQMQTFQPMMNVPQSIMQSQPHLQPQYYQPQATPILPSQGGMMPTLGQQASSTNLPPLQTFPSMSQQQPMQVPGLPQTPPVQNSMPQYTMPMSMQQPGPMQQQPMSQPMPNMAMQQQTYSVPVTSTQPQQQAQHQQPTSAPVVSAYQQVSSVPSSSVDVSAMLAADQQQQQQQQQQQLQAMQHFQDHIPGPTAALLESLAEVTASDEQPQGEDPESFRLRGLANALATAALTPTTRQVITSASGASAVAIDNKIEQAMDLVKSHLMFAVREEVEVLKEKIAELMERISQLESENSILRAGASPEVLAQLPPVQPSQTSNNPS